MVSESDSFIQHYFGGYLFIILLVKYLKHYFKQKRPNGSSGGMPSSRAATVSYIATIAFIRHAMNNVTRAFVLLVCTTLFAMKIINKEHSVMQMVAGAIIGIATAYTVVSL